MTSYFVYSTVAGRSSVEIHVDESVFLCLVWEQRYHQARNQGGVGELLPTKIFVPAGKMCRTYFKSIGHSLKNLVPSQTTLHTLVFQAG